MDSFVFLVCLALSLSTVSAVTTKSHYFDVEDLIWNQCVNGNVSYVKFIMERFGSCAVLNGGSLKGTCIF